MSCIERLSGKIMLVVFGSLIIAGCEGSSKGLGPVIDYEKKEQAERWNDNNDPTEFRHLDGNYEYRIDQLPQSGRAENMPWAGWYWPTAVDAINYKWDGPETDSPTAKYARAFGVNPEALEDAVSLKSGIDSRRSATVCTSDSACDSSRGERCAKRSGETEGRCIPSWFGQCHAWAPAAVMEPEPIDPVTVNGVTFKVQDIKALMTYVYNNVETDFLGGRCNTDDDDVKFDEYGRPVEMKCRDTNPGSLHVIMTNWLGINKRAFVEDRTWDDEVWNQPVVSYEIVKQEEVTKGAASALLSVPEYIYNDDAVKFYHVKADFSYITESRSNQDGNLNEHRYTKTDKLEYILETDRDGRIIGGEWLDHDPHADFLWVPYQAADDYVVGSYTFEYDKIKDLLNKSVGEDNNLETVEVTEEGSVQKDEWQHFGPFTVVENGKLSVVMSGTNDADLYVRKGARPTENDYDCRPYDGDSNEECKVQGGGDVYISVKGYAASSTFSLSITYNQNAGAEDPVDPVEPVDPVAVNETGTVAKGEWRHFGPFSAAGATDFVASMTGTNDADLYVRKDAEPSEETYDCRPYEANSNETCTMSEAGEYYVSVNGYAATSDFELNISYTPAS